MKPVRPIARDNPTASHRPIAVARRTPCDEVPTAGAPVTHSYAVIGFFLGGLSRVEQSLEWSLTKGDVLLLPPGEPHRMAATQHSEYWALSFWMPGFVADGDARLLEPFERVRDGAAAVVHIPDARQAFLEGLFHELERVGRVARSPSGTLDVVQRSLLTLILNEIGSAFSLSASGRATVNSVVIDSLRFIERNCHRRLTLADVAAAVGRSPTYVTSLLKHATGRSAGEWMVSGRMAEARRMLLHSDEMVDVIAERVGYADATHFTRMFRREHGATPAAWRADQTLGPRGTRGPGLRS